MKKIVISLLFLLPSLVMAEARTFTITGYYSPLPNQDYFLTGSYESEISLNGNGTHGADGTPVYPGMIAAPKSYDFGTKVCIPGFGCGTVHDRGGAIVTQGERDLARHDRLDLWMGYGMEGMTRALAWGVQHVDCEMSPAGTELADSVNFSVPLPLTQILNISTATAFRVDLAKGTQGEEVEKLQIALRRLGIYSGEITSQYDALLEQAVLDFQIKFFILHSKKDLGAGRFGPQTRMKLTSELAKIDTQQKIRELWESFEFEAGMSLGHRSPEVVKLQQVLVQQELLDVAPTGFFGQITEQALIEFQLKEGLISSKFDTGAGRVGDTTLLRLNDILNTERAERVEEKQHISQEKKMNARFAVLSTENARFQLAAKILREDASTETLQIVLAELNYFSHDVTGEMGQLTRAALKQFQLQEGLIATERSVGAGVFGPATREKLSEAILRG
jgi:peptidoglycan hydrolase-like protein with peptidoglycan-binding domain/3D (Asp-Asp-Asp) domain-containing protein